MPTTYAMDSSTSGPLVTVNDWVIDPLRIPTAVRELTTDNFIADAMFRFGGTTNSRLVYYRESDQVFSDDGPRVREEYGEPKIMHTSRGPEKSVTIEEIAGSVLVSEEEKDEQIVDPVVKKIRDSTNRFRLEWDRKCLDTIFNHPSVQTQTIANAWDSTNADIRHDLYAAQRLVSSAHPDGMDSTVRFGYKADLLVISEDAQEAVINSAAFNEIYRGNTADEDLRYQGRLEQKVQNLNVVVNQFIPSNKALVMQRGVAGAYVHRKPFVVEPTRWDPDRYFWRTNMRQASVAFLTDPKAITILNGVV